MSKKLAAEKLAKEMIENGKKYHLPLQMKNNKKKK